METSTNIQAKINEVSKTLEYAFLKLLKILAEPEPYGADYWSRYMEQANIVTNIEHHIAELMVQRDRLKRCGR